MAASLFIVIMHKLLFSDRHPLRRGSAVFLLNLLFIHILSSSFPECNREILTNAL
jgi:hypothetical protein